MEEKKTFFIEEMSSVELSEFKEIMESLSTEMKELHLQNIMMAHSAQRDAAHAFLNC